MFLAVAPMLAASASAQSYEHPDSAAAFRELVRSGTARFANRDAAIRAGYRAVGGDFPAMGRHWVHPGIILRGKIDPANPAILSYAEIAGEARLVGVALAVPLAPGEEPPPIAGARRDWHEHNGSVAEESLVNEHSHGGPQARKRLAILHVWSGVDNPDGLFATDNWALPFVRAGISVPEEITPAAARAIALLTGAEDYYLMLIGDSGSREAEMRRSMEASKGEVMSIVRSAAGAPTLLAQDIAALESVWHRLVAALEEIGGDSVTPLRVAVRR